MKDYILMKRKKGDTRFRRCNTISGCPSLVTDYQQAVPAPMPCSFRVNKGTKRKKERKP